MSVSVAIASCQDASNAGRVRVQCLKQCKYNERVQREGMVTHLRSWEAALGVRVVRVGSAKWFGVCGL